MMSRQQNGPSGQRGVNLIELMIVIAVVALIAAIGYPSYLEQVRKTRRADCAGALVSLANAMERHYSTNGSYAGAADAGGSPQIFAAACPIDGGTPMYNLTIAIPVGAATYTLSATPINDQAADKCGTLQLTNRGAKSVNGAAAGMTMNECWR